MLKKMFALILSVLMFAATTFSLLPTPVIAANTTYYVDAVNGNDSYDGRSQTVSGTSGPWRTLSKVNATTFSSGDKILFKSGCTWSGQLAPLGSGSSGSPIIIDMYGGATKPIINGGGTVTDVLYLYNQEYWEINNLEITNNSTSAGTRRGVHLKAADFGTVNHIYLKNLYIHDIKGDMSDKDTGGIFFEVTGTATTTKFNDILIEGCSIRALDRTGIFSRSSWGNRAGTWVGSTNVVVRNNTLDDIGGDGFIIRVCAAPLIEYNVAKDCAKRASSAACDAIWPYNSDDAKFQYNEAYLTRKLSGNPDGQGFDCDWWCNRTIFQYNYSHDNEGGFLLVCSDSGVSGSFNDESVVRYNISQNDKTRVIKVTGNTTDTYIYNNTIFVGSGQTPTMILYENWGGTWPTRTNFYNNIFYNMGSGGYTLGSSTNNVFDKNCFHGSSNRPTGHTNSISSDPLFANPGAAGIGLNTVDGYKLKEGSPCINAGRLVTTNGGKDYWGNSVSTSTASNIGAYNGPAVTPSVTPTPTPTPGSTTTYQAEAYTSMAADCYIKDVNTGYTGSGYADYGGNGSYVEWNNVSASSSGTYRLSLRYAAGVDNRQCEVTVNGTSAGNVPFAYTGSWTTWVEQTIDVPLSAGSNNVIRVTANTTSGGPNLDKMDVSASVSALIDENFDSSTTGGAPAGWTVSAPTDTSCTIAEVPSSTDKSMKFYDNSTSAYASASKNFTAQSGQVTWEFKFMVGATDKWEKFFMKSGSTMAVEMFMSGSSLKYKNSSGQDVTVGSISTNTLYNVKVIADVGTDTFDVYFNGASTPTLSGCTFRNAVSSVDNLLFGSGNSTTGTSYIDDVKVTAQ